MTDNEIIKALECHADRDIETCSLCPLMCVEGCAYELAKNSLDLINRQKAEIERYKGVIKLLEKDVADAKVEAYKEFAEQFKTSAKGMPYEGWLRYQIDIMLKIRAGENNA